MTPEDGAALRALARELAAETDTGAMLEIVCEAGAAQCHAQGAAVLRATAGNAEVVAAIGQLAPARAQRFALPGSLARDVLRTRDIVAVDHFSRSARPLQQAAPSLDIGPLLVAPLIAHDAIVGLLAVMRDGDARPFSDDDVHRIRALSDYAALALWKAELLERAQDADRAKSRFLATVSHELRTPLTALAGYGELLADQVIGPLSEAQLDVLDRMRSVTSHLASVIEEVLAFSSLDEGREVVRLTDFLAADLMRATAMVVEPLARQKHLEFRCTLPDAPIRMTSDIDKIRQILVNLAGNAVKFTDKGEVSLELSRVGEEVHFVVGDTGVGIAARDVDRLFKPFAQLDTTLTRRHGGTGLGLYISRALAELLGGRIELASEPGVGSRFTLVVPVD
jgi:signal transduction histidine kinase